MGRAGPGAEGGPVLGPGCPLAILAWLLAWLALVPALPALGLTLTPGVETGVGYDDNIKVEKEPRGDFFAIVRPQFTLEAGQADDRLSMQGRADYIWYGRYDSESRLQEGSLTVNWRHAFSQTWFLEAANLWSSSYDAVEVDEFGALAQVRRGGGRRDRNTTSLRATTLLGPQSQAFIGYSLSTLYNNDEASEDITYHKAEAGLIYRLAPRWRTEAHLEAKRDDYQRSDDINRLNGELVLAYLLGPSSETFVGVSTGTVRSQSQEPLVQQARDYDMYSAWVGYKDQVTQSFGYEVTLGAMHIVADSRFNSAAGNTYPTAKASLSYRQRLHLLRAYAETRLGEYDNLGQNAGLTVTRRVGASWQWDFARHWMLLLQADFIHDEFQQSQVARELTAQGDTDSLRLGGNLAYRISRYWKISLDYRYLSRDTQFHTDDVAQNRIMMMVSAEWPQRW